MLYAIIGQDAEDSLPLRKKSRQLHIARLENLIASGRLIMAGPFPAIDSEDPGPAGFSGSLIVAEFVSLEAAREWANDEPYLASGAFVSVDVRPFKQVLP